jgi:hypothetical protein
MDSTSVIVVGMQTGMVEEATLNMMSQAGGFARVGGPPYFYLAEDGAGLERALLEITGLLVSCTFPLDMVPPDPDQIIIVVNGQPVMRDAENGFELGPDGRSIVFHGRTCDSLQAGPVPNISATFGCPPPGKPTRHP